MLAGKNTKYNLPSIMWQRCRIEWYNKGHVKKEGGGGGGIGGGGGEGGDDCATKTMIAQMEGNASHVGCEMSGRGGE